MGFSDFIFWPFVAVFTGTLMIIGILLFAFWVWMIVDCARRKFRKDTEKIFWIVIIVLAQWLGALVYFIVIRLYNQRGLMKK